MIILDNLGVYRRGRLWIDSFPNIKFNPIETLELSVKAASKQNWSTRSLALELLLAPREISNYALIGVKFVPEDTEELKIIVKVSRDDEEILHDTFALTTDEVHIGIPREYAMAILTTAQDTVTHLGGFPSGILEFDLGAHGYVGSSKSSFLKLTKIALGLINKDLNKMSTHNLKQLVLEQILFLEQ